MPRKKKSKDEEKPIEVAEVEGEKSVEPVKRFDPMATMIITNN